MIFSYSPASASEYDLSELTYIPSGSNYCTALTFTGYSSSGTAVSATILISVTASPVSEVYSVTTKGTSVNFPANSVYSAVASATGFGLSSIQLLELPASTAGVLYVGSYAADTTSAYSYGSDTDSMSQLRFIPNSGYHRFCLHSLCGIEQQRHRFGGRCGLHRRGGQREEVYGYLYLHLVL